MDGWMYVRTYVCMYVFYILYIVYSIYVIVYNDTAMIAEGSTNMAECFPWCKDVATVKGCNGTATLVTFLMHPLLGPGTYKGKGVLWCHSAASAKPRDMVMAA